MTRVLAVAAALSAALVLASPVEAAAPNYILVSGAGLRRPVLLANWNENLVLLLAVADARRAGPAQTHGLSRRRKLDLAEFWGWSGQPRPTKPNEANQHGWFAPAHGTQPPLIDLQVRGVMVPRIVPARVLAIFHRHGVPTHF